MRLSTPHLTQIQALMWHIHSAQNAQGQSQWIVLKSKPNKMQIQDEGKKRALQQQHHHQQQQYNPNEPAEALKNLHSYTFYCDFHSDRFQSISFKQSL